MENIDIFRNELVILRSQAMLLVENQKYEEFDQLLSQLKTLLRKNADIIDLAICNTEIRSAQLDLQRCISYFFYAYEKAWSLFISESETPKKTLKIYPGYEGYKVLTYSELKRATPKKVKKILFVGSGPVPMTPIFLAYKKINVDCIDISREACELADSLTKKLGIRKYMRFIESDILEYDDFQTYDIVWVAVMAGATDEQKKVIVKHLRDHIRSKQILIMRTGFGIGKFIYATIDQKYFDGFLVSSNKPFSELLTTYFVRTNKELRA